MDKKTILIVDDEPDALECIHEIVTRNGYESITCSDAASALKLLASGVHLDLAIFDLIMPDMNGHDLHSSIKELRPGLPCIIITGYASVESYLTAISSGVFEYLNKPYRCKDLVAVIAAALATSTKMCNGSGRIAVLNADQGAENKSDNFGEAMHTW